MQKFIVPQFIDIESKIFGPITIRQFATVGVGALLIFITYKLAEFTLFLFLAAIILLFTIVVGFLKINGQGFHIFILNFIGTYKKPGLRVWSKEEYKSEKASSKKKGDERPKVFVPKRAISSVKLSELALIIDTGGIYKGEAEADRLNQAYYQGKL